ncbi:unnamed protein product [Phytophthora lilii]|uniref:Unnamed protein product n=1 Tax=Phytophthora lilii TaxID=2077276 RepID=A0A9W6UAQ6_9STRA|nr:unnamed protein product [Phytophthora lilii]
MDSTSAGAAAGAATWGYFKLNAPDRKLLISWIHDTWSAVHASTISAGFKKCGFIERLDANDEDASTTTATNEMLENAGDIVDEVLSAGCLDKSAGAFSVDDDFDDMFELYASLKWTMTLTICSSCMRV